MKYKVIKSFPGYNEGDILDTEVQRYFPINLPSKDTSINERIEEWKEYFQLIEERKSVWDLKEGDRYFFIDTICDIISTDWFGDDWNKQRRDSGNCFLTKEQAEKELEKREIITRLLRSKEEMGLNKEFVFGEENYFLFQGNNLSIYYLATTDTNFILLLGYFSTDSQDYIDKNKTDLELLFNL